jgi:non-heme Fe2+,alpha-ketoglutarate-dependent halogenase
MGKKLSASEVARYERDGLLSPVDAFSLAEARHYRGCLEVFEREHGREFGKGHNFKPHLLFRWADEIVHHPAVLNPVEDMIGPDIRLFHLSVWPKNAHDPAFVSWHQDATYFGLEPAVQVTAWVALTDASIEAGCMEAIPVSHKWGQLHHRQSEASANLLSRGFGKRTAKRRCITKRPEMQARLWLTLIGLFLSLTVAGCADKGATSDDDKRGVFYGGVTGGRTWP